MSILLVITNHVKYTGIPLFISNEYYRTKEISVSNVKINLFTQKLMKTRCRIMRTDNGKCVCF